MSLRKYLITSFSPNKPFFSRTLLDLKSLFSVLPLPYFFFLQHGRPSIRSLIRSLFLPSARPPLIISLTRTSPDNHFAKSSNASAIVGTAKLSGAGVTNTNDLAKRFKVMNYLARLPRTLFLSGSSK